MLNQEEDTMSFFSETPNETFGDIPLPNYSFCIMIRVRGFPVYLGVK